MVSILFPSLVTAQTLATQAELQSLQQDIEKIKHNLNQDPPLFTKFAAARYGIQARFGLIDAARLDGSFLINPRGGTIDLSTLSRLPGLTHVTLLPQGGFRFTYAPSGGEFARPSDITIQGVQSIQATPNSIKVDGLEIRPAGKLSVRRLGDSILIRGSGTFSDGTTTLHLYSPEKDATLTTRQSRITTATLSSQTRMETYLTSNGHEVRPLEGDITWHTTKETYDQSRGNKIHIGEKVSVSQSTGKLLLDRYYVFKDSSASLVRRAFLGGPPSTAVSYTHQGKTASALGPVPTGNLQGYRSIADLFEDYGYGTGSQNKQARAAYYTQYLGQTYRGTARQNVALLEKIKNGEILFFPEGERRFEFSPESGSTQQTVTLERSTSRPEQISRTQTPILSTRRNTALLRKTSQYFSPDTSPGGRLETVDSPPEGISPVRGKVTYYYTPVYNPGEKEGVSERSLASFKQLVRREGSGIFYSETDGRWYHQNYQGKISPLSSRNQYGVTASGKTPFLGMIAAPRNIPLGSIAYIETSDGSYARFLVGDRGGAIKVKGGQYRIDIWAGLGRQSILSAERTRTVGGVRIPPNPRIYFAPPEA